MWVYGAPADGLLTESTPTAPTGPYSAAHLHNESVLRDSAQDLGLDVSILRMANLVGPDPFYRYRSKVSFAHELVEMAVRNKVIVLRSPPSTPRNLLTRTLLHHDLTAVLDRNVVKRRVDIINLGGGNNPIDLMTVIGMIEKFLGKKANIQNREFHIADIKKTWADISKANQLLGWQPSVGLEEGVRRSVEWHLANKHHNFQLA